MRCRDFLKDNAFRFAAMAAALAALGFDYQSIRDNETDICHKNYDIANAIGPLIGIFNIAGRMLDHKGEDNKRKNNIAGGVVIFILSLQTCFSVASFTTEFKQPVALPLLIGSLCSLFFTGVNWEPHQENAPDKSYKKLVKNNAGRVGSMVFSGVGLALSISSVVENKNVLFFATGTSLGFASVFDSASRANDIVNLHKNDTYLFNKISAIACFITMFVNAVVSLLGTVSVWNQPTDFSSAMIRLALVFNIVSQLTLPHKKEEQLLLASQPVEAQVNFSPV